MGIDHHPPLLEWVRLWSGHPSLKALTPEGWFEKGYGITRGMLAKQNVWIPLHFERDQMFLWAPPPTVADAAMEELLRSQHKRVDLFHVVVIPRLMAPRWQRYSTKCVISLLLSHLVPSFGWQTCTNLYGSALCCHCVLQALVPQASPTAGGDGTGNAAGARVK